MPGIYEHLNFKRETKSPERRRHPAPPKPYNGNPTEHSSSLKRDIDLIKEKNIYPPDNQFPIYLIGVEFSIENRNITI